MGHAGVQGRPDHGPDERFVHTLWVGVLEHPHRLDRPGVEGDRVDQHHRPNFAIQRQQLGDPPADVVPHQCGIVEAQRLQQLKHVAGLARRRERRGIIRLVGVAVAEEVGGDHPEPRRQHRHEISPQVRRGREPVDKDRGGTVALVDVGQLSAGDTDAALPQRHRDPRIASTTRRARTTGPTSWTLTTWAPRPAIHAAAPIVPSRRSSTGASPRAVPMNDFLEGPTTTGTPSPAKASSIPGSRAPDTSLTTTAPASRAARATSGLRVSIEIGTSTLATSAAKRLITGRTRLSSSSTVTWSDPGRVDSPPTSTMAAPSSAIATPCPTAASWSRNRPPSEKESGVTFRTPMTSVVGPHWSDR